MSTGLIALLDDIAALAKVAATSLDDIAAQTIKAGTKSAGVVIDDAAVTPRYVVGFDASRELPIVAKIAWGSIKNKLLFLLPAALLLSLIAPWLITPLLMLGGGYLCYEGAEKVLETLFPHQAHQHEEQIGAPVGNPEQLEEERIAGAIRTDFILSAEIMAITLAAVPDSNLWTQGAVLALVGIGITIVVYGSVALIVKADDVGVVMGRTTSSSPLGKLSRGIGKALVVGMPYFLKLLAIVGTVAMLWVGGSIVMHGLAEFGFHLPEHLVHSLGNLAPSGDSTLAGFIKWMYGATGAGVFGLIVGALLIPVVQFVIAPIWNKAQALKSS
ncbi:MAG: DUF808 domain-containing protein [Gammaproteobacteria bacterium]|nr:DUF808 domain-containing protein [Gammaproteobacteria bacterium]